ncbi:MAG: Na+/H+ antiporter NhaC family protein [Pseudomonadales bacterium]|nr:Na+/H+ antiporter NhaC family protein [Pseudomonadales bacterium]
MTWAINMQSTRPASALDLGLVIGTIMVLLALSVYLYGSDSSVGANQIALACGAVINAAYFGDKMSLLPDTTNLAPATTGIGLFTHIRHMTWTTAPSITLALIISGMIGAGQSAHAGNCAVQETLTTLETQFSPGLVFLLPVVVVIWMAARRMRAPSPHPWRLDGGDTRRAELGLPAFLFLQSDQPTRLTHLRFHGLSYRYRSSRPGGGSARAGLRVLYRAARSLIRLPVP